MKCSKCKISPECGVWYTHHGQLFHFCKICADILNTYPFPQQIIKQFIKPDIQRTKVDKAILNARTRRVLEEPYWSNSSQDVVG